MLTKLFRLLGIGAAATALGLATCTPANASWYDSTVGGWGATIRDCYHPNRVWPPSLGCRSVVVVPAGAHVRVVCQVRGQNINGYYGTTDLWDYVVWEGGGGRPEGFASDANINTGHSYWIPGIDICH